MIICLDVQLFRGGCQDCTRGQIVYLIFRKSPNLFSTLMVGFHVFCCIFLVTIAEQDSCDQTLSYVDHIHSNGVREMETDS